MKLPKPQLSINYHLKGFKTQRRVRHIFSKINKFASCEITKSLRYIFSHRDFKKILGSNIALAVVATSALPVSIALPDIGGGPVVISAPEAPITTNIVKASVPVRELKITQKFRFYHPGVDLDGKTGDPITPIREGRIEKVVYSKFSYGNHVYINHGEGVVSLYAHLSKIFVKEGDLVEIDQVIGFMGSTGRSTGDHLHLEVYIDGKPIDPLRVIQ